MIYGCGVDLTYIPEFMEVMSDPKSFFIGKYFTDNEINYVRAKGERRGPGHLAGRYAAKEAFIKALDGPRLHQKEAIQIDYKEIEIRNDDSGRPYLKFYGKILDYLNKIGINKTHLSISHVGDYATAQVIIEIL